MIALKITAESIAEVGEWIFMTSIALSHGSVPANSAGQGSGLAIVLGNILDTIAGWRAAIVAAAAGKLFVGSGSHVAIFCQAIAGGAALTFVAHAIVPESIHDAGSLIALPTVAGFLFALWLALVQSFV